MDKSDGFAKVSATDRTKKGVKQKGGQNRQKKLGNRNGSCMAECIKW